MSKIQRKAFDKKHAMPDFKVMGTINSTIADKLSKLVLTGDKTDIIEIIEHINSILKTNISDISADVFVEPFEGDAKFSTEYITPTGLIYLITKGNAKLHVADKIIDTQPNKIYFVNDRNTHRVSKNNNNRLIMLSAKFIWDKVLHGG